jgi:hypothetical protein
MFTPEIPRVLMNSDFAELLSLFNDNVCPET